MASIDPKKTTSARADYDADEDPLVELARIVSEDAGFSGRMTERPAVRRATPPADRQALSADLEAELLQELETSFSRRETPPPPPQSFAAAEPAEALPVEEPEAPEPMGRREPSPEEDSPDDLLRSIERQLSQFERRVRPESFADEDDRDAAEASVASEPGDWREEPRTAAARTEYRFRGPAAAGGHLDEPEGFVERPQLEVPTSVAEAGAADLFGADDRIEDAEAGAGDAGSDAWPPADRGAPDLAGLEAELSRELEPDYGDHDADQWEESGGEEPERPAPVAAAAVIAPEHGMRPPPRPAQPQRTGSRRGLMTAAAVLVVVVLGGAAAMYLRAFDQGPSGPPPVIAAPQGPVKIEPAPAESAGGEETVGEAVYNRVAGGAPNTEENVVEGAEEPQELARIVLPPSEAENAAGGPIEGEAPEVAAEAPQPAEEAQGSAEEFGPRRVPTYVVRPDGTIVTTAEAGAPAGPRTGEDLATAQTEEMEPKPVATVTIDEPRTAGTPASQAAEEPVAATELAPPPAALAEESAESEVAAVELPEEPASPIAAPIVEEVDEPVVAVAPAPEPAPAAPPPTASSGFLVQISSQTSQEAAQTTFANLQQRYPAILGSLTADIQRADLGPKGIYFRVRVGPWGDRGEAVEVCEALQAAGGDCFVTQ